MKITKDQLMEIIWEEFMALTPSEFDPSTLNQKQIDRLGAKLTKIRNRMWGKGMYDMDPEKAKEYLKHVKKMGSKPLETGD